MKWSSFGRVAMALLSALALGLSMTACGGGTIAYLWVIGQQYSQITGFKVDHYTGNLTTIPHLPMATSGKMPVSLALRTGGRYVYVLNQGSASTSKGNSPDANVSAFAVGGEGALTFQASYASQGYVPTWATFDSTGTFLFVLDRYAKSGDGNGSITTFSTDPNTGRLSVVPQTASTPSGGTAPTFLEVGANPIMMTTAGNCLFTLNTADQSITPYATSNGQLTVATTGKLFLGFTDATSIHASNAGNYVVVTDAAPTSNNPGGRIFPFTVTSGCGLASLTGGSVNNDATVTNPVYSLFDQSGKYLFILNQSSTSTATSTPYSSITGYSVQTGGSAAELSPISGSPFASAASPVCMVEDPTQQFFYVSNHDSGTISGYGFTSTQGPLTALPRGSTFTAVGLAGCLVLSGNVDE